MITRRHAVRLSAVIVLLVSCVGCDLLTKHVAQSHLKGQPPHSYLGDMVRLQYAENPGAFLGLGQQMPDAVRWGVLVVVNGLITTVLASTIIFRSRMAWWRVAACALLLAGAIGNLIDRVRFDGLVVDFMNLGIGPLRSGIFNVADMAIMAGAIALMVPAVLGDKKATATPGPVAE